MNEKVVLLIVGAVVGGSIGFASSYLMWRIQKKYSRKNIAQGFFLEISSLEETIALYVGAFNAPGPGAGVVSIDQSLYNDGLFYVLRKEIFNFKQKLSKKILDFYSHLLTAEELRRHINDCILEFKETQKGLPPKSITEADLSQIDSLIAIKNKKLKSAITEAYTLLPNLKELLKKEF